MIKKYPINLDLSGTFDIEYWYKEKLLDSFNKSNNVANQAKNRFLDISFYRVPKITSWWMGLIDNINYTSVAITDVYNQINGTNGWIEFTNYTDTNNANNATTRPLWNTDIASGQAISNTTIKSLFDITGNGAIRGIFLVGGAPNAQTKNDRTNGNAIIWASAILSDIYPIVAGAQFKVTYTIDA